MVVAVEVAEEDVQGVVVGLEEAVGEVEGGLGGRVGAVVVLAQGGRRDFDLRGHFSDQLDNLFWWLELLGSVLLVVWKYCIQWCLYIRCAPLTTTIGYAPALLKSDARAASCCLGETELIAFQWRIGRLCSLVLILSTPNAD